MRPWSQEGHESYLPVGTRLVQKLLPRYLHTKDSRVFALLLNSLLFAPWIMQVYTLYALQKLNGIQPLQGCPSHPVEVSSLDLASLDSVKAFASSFNAKHLPLALLVCNAGIMAPPKRKETQNGCELQFQVHVHSVASSAPAAIVCLSGVICCLSFSPTQVFFTDFICW